MATESARVIVTLPVYRDTAFLEKSSEKLEELTAAITKDFILLIAEDGSDSSSIVDRLRARYPNIVYRQHGRRLGRGKALRDAWRSVQGDFYVYLDVDLATDLTKLDAYRRLIEGLREFDLVTGSRYASGSVTDRPRLRRLASIAYNLLVRALFHTGVHDHQCGFKSFSRRLVDVLSIEAKSDSWFWDTEVIVLARKFGFRVLEIPVHWAEKKGSRTPITRLMGDIWLHGTGLLMLIWRVYFEK